MADKIQITVDALSKRFNREWIFKGLNYTFQSGNTYAVTGPNGSGKSTLMQVLWGQMPPTSGSIGFSLHNKSIGIEEAYKYISIATPYMDLIEEFTLLEQLKFHFKLKQSRDNLSIQDITERMYLESSKDKYIANFSSGMKQRLKLGLAFFTKADAVFLDEPGTNLDKQAFLWYQQQLNLLHTDSLIFIASNDPDEYPVDAIKLNVMDYK